ncbi:MAG TPA: AlkA N-terminal domain-containing protein [Steroidobacteraceae bacterium]|nr:AlkA N-terminal domain-containing protein [Steroidobacteraceae bacterium]
MEFDEQTCEQARLSRDARFDGRIFIGITSTGIYCRPICPSPHAKRAHVRFFPSAAAASAAGFRPCLRCRPEVAPGTPAWNGTSTTVSRGLRLIAEGALDEASIETLAARLGVSSRHLSRLFRRHLGALPTTVAQTRRLHFAKQLISDTNLSMADVAMASGFRSIRRFNDVFRKFHGRPPLELRRLGARTGVGESEYVFQLAFRPPYDWNLLLRFLAPRSVPGVEAVRDGAYRRTLAIQSHHGLLDVRPAPGANALRVHITFPKPEYLLQIVARVRAMFDLAADPDVIGQILGSDSLLAPLLERHSGVRLPGAWDNLEPVVHAVLRRRFSLDETQSLQAQLVEECGEPLSSLGAGELYRTFPSAAVLAGSRLDFLPRLTADAVRSAARAVAALRSNAPPDDLLAKLRAVNGVDDAVIQYVAMRALNDSDALPAEFAELHGVFDATSGWQELLRRAEAWKPWRAYASMLLMCPVVAAGKPARSGAGLILRASDQLEPHFTFEP